MVSRYVLLLFLCVCCTLPARAQGELRFAAGYVVVAGDTLRGEVQERSDLQDTRDVVFRAASGERTVYTPAEVEGFGLDSGRHFRRHTVAPLPEHPEEPLFLRVLVDGPMTLYTFVDAASVPTGTALTARSSPVRFAVEDQAGTLRPLYRLWVPAQEGRRTGLAEDPHYRRHLAIALAPCPEVQARAEHVTYEERALVRIVSAFNECAGGAFTVAPAAARRQRGVLRVHSPMVRVGYGTSELSSHYRDGTESQGSPFVAASIDVQALVLSPRISFPVELAYRQVRAEDPAAIRPFRAEEWIASSFGAGLGVRYRHTLPAATPYVAGGATLAYSFGEKAGPRRFYQTEGNTVQIWNANIPAVHAGGYVEFGAERALGARRGVSAALRVERAGLETIWPGAALTGKSHTGAHTSWQSRHVLGVVGIRL